jgi:crossover junction endodeoxyribonuclease RuvC
MTPEPTRVIGIDPGLQRTGYGVIERSAGRTRIIEAGIIRLSPKDSLATRLAKLHEDLAAILDETRPFVMAVEELYSHYERPTTAILMGHARGVILLSAERAGVRLASYAATQVKKFVTGSGRAAKDQMQLAIAAEFGLTEPPEPPDVADALAIALCHVHHERIADLPRYAAG